MKISVAVFSMGSLRDLFEAPDSDWGSVCGSLGLVWCAIHRGLSGAGGSPRCAQYRIVVSNP